MSTATYRGEKTVIETLLSQATSLASDRLAWPNVKFSPPDTGFHIRARINNQEPFAREIPARNGSKSHPGLLTVDIYGPVEEEPAGEGQILDLAEEIIDAFTYVTVQGIRFRAPWIANRGPAGSRYRIQVDCPFDRITTP